MTKTEYRELQRGVAYLRRMAEELVDECCSFETDLNELNEKSGHRKSHNNKYVPLVACADISDSELDNVSPELRKALGYDPEPTKSTDMDCA